MDPRKIEWVQSWAETSDLVVDVEDFACLVWVLGVPRVMGNSGIPDNGRVSHRATEITRLWDRRYGILRSNETGSDLVFAA